MINWNQQPLGREPDATIARRLGVSRERVRQMRARAGIPKYDPWTPEMLALLGTLPDAEVARRTGFHWQAVFLRRRARGIAPAPRKPRRSERLGIGVLSVPRGTTERIMEARDDGESRAGVIRRLMLAALDRSYPVCGEWARERGRWVRRAP